MSARFGVMPLHTANYRSGDRSLQNEEAEGEPLIQNCARSAAHQWSINRTTAAPALLLPLPYIPLGLAIFIAGTRYFDFRNHGFDVLAGSAVGTITAWFGFRLYHPLVVNHLRCSVGAHSDQAE